MPLIPSTADWWSELARPQGEHAAFGQYSFNGVQSYYSYKPLLKHDWYAFAVAPVELFDQLLQQLIHTNIYLALFGLLVGLLLAHLMVQPILGNIRQIKQQTRNLAEGRLDQRVEVHTGMS